MLVCVGIEGVGGVGAQSGILIDSLLHPVHWQSNTLQYCAVELSRCGAGCILLLQTLLVITTMIDERGSAALGVGGDDVDYDDEGEDRHGHDQIAYVVGL